MTYQLYWRKGTGSMAPMAALEEVGAAYELIEVTQDENYRPSEDYIRDVHPLGLVPVLVLPDGELPRESGAILTFLASAHPEAALLPPPGTTENARALQWLFYGADMIYPEYKRYYYPFRYVASPDSEEAMKEKAVSILERYWDLVERDLGAGPWLAGQHFSAADLYIAMLATWYPDPGDFAAKNPAVTLLVRRAAERPAMAKALELHGEEIP